MKKLMIQGDVALRLVKRPLDLKPAGEGSEVLALGTESGHGHVLQNCEVFISTDSKRYVVPYKKPDAEPSLVHMHLATKAMADHAPISIPPSNDDEAYLVLIQNEHDPFTKAMAQVND